MVEILDVHARKHDLEELAIEDMSANYSYRKLAEKGSTSVTVSIHCELKLALHALQQPSPQALPDRRFETLMLAQPTFPRKLGGGYELPWFDL